MSISLIDLFAYMFGLIAYDGNYTIDWIVRTAAICAWSAAMRVLLGSRYRKALNLLTKGWGMMLLCTASMYGTISMIAGLSFPDRAAP